jgi:hypothetical protein
VDLRKCYMDESSPFLNSFRHFGEALMPAASSA